MTLFLFMGSCISVGLITFLVWGLELNILMIRNRKAKARSVIEQQEKG